MKELTYTRCGDYYIPDLKLSEQPEAPIGKYFSFNSSESIHMISTFALHEIPPCFSASTTLRYAS